METKILDTILEKIATSEKWGYESFYEWETSQHDYGEVRGFIKYISKIYRC